MQAIKLQAIFTCQKLRQSLHYSQTTRAFDYCLSATWSRLNFCHEK